MKLAKLAIVSAGVLFSLSVYAAETTVYQCEDGQRFEAAYPDTNTAILNYQGQLYLLKSAISANGARYTGEGLQWWTTGNQGTLAPLAKDQNIASHIGKTCYALQLPKKETN